MKRKSVMLMIFMMASTIIFAQRYARGDAQDRADKFNEYMKKELSLTDDQYAKVKSINQTFGERFRNLRRDSTTSKEAARAEMKKIRDEHATALKGVLTDKQYEQWTALKKSRKGIRGRRERAEYLKKELLLNYDQYSKVKAIDERFGKQFKTLRSDSTMSGETARVAFKKIRDEKNTAIKSVLTPDQYEKWLSLKSKRSHDFRKREGAPANPDDKKG